ncbi:MAG TPA: hypothetical protein VF764_09440, partial [Steroidobacteraceae bacterium]
MTRGGMTATLIWALCALLAAIIAVRARYTADLSAFLPRRASATQSLLVEQLREGPAAHLIIAAIAGADAETRAAVSRQMALRLRTNPAVLAIDNGNEAQLERDREFLFEHRYLLSPRVSPELFTARGLHAAIGAALEVTAGGGQVANPDSPWQPGRQHEACHEGGGDETCDGVEAELRQPRERRGQERRKAADRREDPEADR